MINIFVVSTKIGTGKGGISTALIGYVESDVFKYNVNLHPVTSHVDGKRLLPMFSAARYILKNCSKGDVVWLHCGPWWSMIMKLLLACCAKVKGGKIYFHLHSPTLDNYLSSRIKTYLMSKMFSLANGIIVLTPWWKKRLLRKIPELDNIISVSFNPLDANSKGMALNKSTKRSVRRDHTFKVLAMARLVEDKGFEDILKSFTCLPSNFILTIAGDGPLYDSLNEQVSSLGLESRVSFTGWVDYKDKPDLFNQHDIFFLPSKYDSFGMGFIEAMAAGLPVVALKYQAIPDVVESGKVGVLATDNSPVVLADSVIECSKNLEYFSAEAKAYVLRKFDNEKISSAILEIFYK
ncbi:glycosyltransferase family 4 protein [Vibrio campbellii]|uniref:glycosyltransferase family 4 protein n=1 Tax=Vibrio campbellii TaxID=680 RepID=UPI000B1152E0|nr:glycosyltransferase family 4 protein [Vibrio campbellii]